MTTSRSFPSRLTTLAIAAAIAAPAVLAAAPPAAAQSGLPIAPAQPRALPSAQDTAPTPSLGDKLAAEGEDIPLDDWVGMTSGRTVWYRIDGNLWGRESYRDAPGHVIFQFPDGECLDANWTYEAPWYCFDFGPALGGAPHCFRHVRYEGRLWALARSGKPQAIDRIDAAPVTCGANPSS